MRAWARVLGGLLLCTAVPVYAQYDYRQECRNNGEVYPEGARICSNNLTLLCVNAEWQNLDGARCSDPGAYLNPDQAYIVQDPVIEVPEPLPPPSWAR